MAEYKKGYSAGIGCNNNQSSMIVGADTFEKCLADLIKSSMFYLGLGYSVQCNWISEFCLNCNGEGQVLKRSVRWIKCPSCKGHGKQKQIIKSFPITLGKDTTVKTT